MNRKLICLFFIIMMSILLISCATLPYKDARDVYGEIFFAVKYIESEKRFIGLGENNFGKGEGLIYIYPDEDGEYYNLKIYDSFGSVVYTGNEYVQPTWIRWVYLSKINLAKGKYTVKINFKNSSRSFEKEFWMNEGTLSATDLQTIDDFYIWELTF